MKKSIITALCLLSITNHANAQTPLFQQLNSRPKGVTNLAEPQKYLDSFLGQDKVGPYVLSWRNLYYVPGYPVLVYVDNLLFRTNDYTLDATKGEITFNRIIKRSEIVRVEYNYFPESAAKNANPTLTAPLTIKLASNSYSGLTFTALNNQNLTSAPTMVLGYSFNKGGLSTNYYVNPNGKSIASDNAMKLGYNLGTTNNFSANYEKSDKSFSPYAKSFGAIDSGEKSNVGGKYSISKNTNLSFNNSSFRSLNSVVNNNNTSAQFAINGKANQPSFNLSFNESEAVDAKNVKTSSSVQNANFNSQLGEGSLNFKSTRNDGSTNGTRSVNNQDILSYRAKQLQAGRTQDYKIDPKIGTVSSVSDTLSYSTKILGGSVAFAGNQTDSLINNKEIQNDQYNYSLSFKGNSRGFKGVSLNRNEVSTTVSNSQTNVTNDKLAIGFKEVNYSTNTITTQIGSTERKDLIDNSLTYNLPIRKNSPVFSISSIDAIKRNDKGVLVGSSNEAAVFKHKLSGFLFNVKLGQTTNYNPNGSVETIDNSTGNLSFKIGPGSLITENVNNQIIIGNNKPINQESFKFNYSIAPAKNMPGIELERADANSTQDVNMTNVVSDKLKLSSKIGSTVVNATTTSSATDNNTKVTEVKNNNLNINTPIWGPSSSLSLSLNNNASVMPNGQETKNGLGVNLSPSKNLTLSSEQSDSKIFSATGSVVNFATNNKFGLSYNLSGALLQTSLNTIDTNTTRSEVVDYRTVVGNDKTLLKVDSFVRMRESTSKDVILNRDTTQTSINLNTSKNFKVAGTYVLNPDDPTKPGQTIPFEKRTFGMDMSFGKLTLNGSYSALEHLPGTPADVITKNGGFNLLGESGIKLGYKAGSSNFYSEYKDQFFYGTNLKGMSTYTIGFSQQNNRFNFSINGTAIQNKNNSGYIQDYRAEAKLGVKF